MRGVAAVVEGRAVCFNFLHGRLGTIDRLVKREIREIRNVQALSIVAPQGIAAAEPIELGLAGATDVRGGPGSR